MPSAAVDLVGLLDEKLPPCVIREVSDMAGEEERLQLAYVAGRRSVVDDLKKWYGVR